MGGSAIGGDLAAAALGDRRTVARRSPSAAIELPPWATRSGRSSAPATPATPRRRSPACGGGRSAGQPAGSSPPPAETLAELARDEDVPVIGLPRSCQPRAAVGYMFAVAAEAAALAGAGPRLHDEIDAAALTSRSRARARRDLAGDRRAARAHDPGDLRRRPHRAGRPPLEDPDQREREGPPPSGPSCRRPTTTRSRAGATTEARAAQRRLPRGRRPAPARAAADRAHRRAVSEAAGGGRCGSTTEGETRTERLLWAVMLGDLVSRQLAALPGVDPTPMRGDRQPEAAAFREPASRRRDGSLSSPRLPHRTTKGPAWQPPLPTTTSPTSGSPTPARSASSGPTARCRC